MNESQKIIAIAASLFFCISICSCDDDDEVLPVVPSPSDTPHECICPDFLKVGEQIAIVSPSYVTDDETIAKEKPTSSPPLFLQVPPAGPLCTKKAQRKLGLYQ